MIEHPGTLVAQLEEYQAKEQTAQQVMEQLDGQCQTSTRYSQ